MKKQFLVAPGPTPVPEQARLAMAESLLHHRGPDFKAIFEEVRAQLKWVFQTEAEVLTLTCSGTGAFEAAMVNFTKRDDTVIVIGGGKFGERWGEVGTSYGMKVVEVPVEWGKVVDLNAFEHALNKHPNASMVTLSVSETSTGVLHPLSDIVELTKKHGKALLAVDGITAVGVHDIPMDEMGIDILVSGSQKSFSIPPGLGFVAASQRAWSRAEASDHPRYYFDLRRELKNHLKNQTAFTPAISLIVGLRVVLRMMQEEGLEAIFDRHRVLAEATRAGVQALGLGIFPEVPANSVTAASVPDGVNASGLVSYMRKDGVTIAAGQDRLKDTTIRIGHLGYFDSTDIVVALASLERALHAQGQPIEFGSSIRALQIILAGELK
jgi:aspartate aminotransferase-like enzyme